MGGKASRESSGRSRALSPGSVVVGGDPTQRGQRAQQKQRYPPSRAPPPRGAPADPGRSGRGDDGYVYDALGRPSVANDVVFIRDQVWHTAQDEETGRLPPTSASSSAPAVSSHPGPSDFAGDGTILRYTLDVIIVSARGLRDADWLPFAGGSDPYCICEVQGNGKSKFQTRTVDNCNNPEWKQAGIIDDFYQGDSLLFTIFDKDFGKEDDLLGKVELSTQQIAPGGFEGELTLRETGVSASQKVNAYLTVQVIITSKQAVSREAIATSPMLLRIAIISARGLRDADWMPGQGKSDPYVTCQLHCPDGKKVSGDKAHIKTHSIPDTLEPEWDHEGNVLGFMPGMSLKFEVWDEDFGKSDDFLGRVAVKSHQILDEGLFEKELQLEDAGEGVLAFLTVRIATAFKEVERLKRIALQHEKHGFHDRVVHEYTIAREILEEAGSLQSAEGASLLQSMAAAERHQQSFGKAVAILKEATKFRRHSETLATKEGAKLLADLGNASLAVGALDAALDAFSESRRIFEATDTLFTPDGAALLANVGNLRLISGNPAGAITDFEEALKVQTRCNLLDTTEEATLLINIGVARQANGNSAGALEAFGFARELLDRLGALRTEDGAELLRNQGIVLRQKGDLIAAKIAFKEAKSIRDQLGIVNTPAGARLLTNLGVAQAQAGEPHVALSTCQEAWRIRDQTSTLDSPEGAALLLNVGCMRESLGDLGGALGALNGSKEIRERTGTLESITGAELLRSIGNVCLALGQTEPALQRYSEAKALRQRLGCLRTSGGAELMRDMGLACCKDGNLGAALRAFEEALEICQACNCLSTGTGALLLTNLGSLHRRTKDDSKAIEAFTEAKGVYGRLGLLDSAAGLSLLESLERVQAEAKARECQTASDRAAAEAAAQAAAAARAEKAKRESVIRQAMELERTGLESCQAGSWHSAIEAYDKAVQLRSSLGSGEGSLHSPEGANALAALGTARRGAGNVDGAVEGVAAGTPKPADDPALQALEEERRRHQQAKTLQTRQAAYCLMSLGAARGRHGDLSGALEAFKESKESYAAIGAMDSEEGVALLSNVAFTQAQRGNAREAVKLYREAKTICERLGVLDTPAGQRVIRSLQKADAQ